MPFRESSVKFQSLQSCRLGLCHYLLRVGIPRPLPNLGIKRDRERERFRQTSPSSSVSGIFVESLCKIVDAFLRSFQSHLVQLVTPLEISFERLGIDRVGAGESSLLFLRQLDVDLLRYISGYFALQC